MSGDGLVRAILGPTNTGKTYLAIERMCAHSSGVIGFPLRLLAREVYDRVVQMKGANQVALITGEERIVPQGARYFLCTAESMPVQGDTRRRSRLPARFRLRRDRRSPARHRSRARPCLHRPHASRPRPRGNADPRLGHAEAADPRAAARGGDRQPAALFDPALCRLRPSFPACRRAARSSPSRPSRSTRWPKCCAASRAARRWSWARCRRPPATPRSPCSSAARSIISSPPTPSAWASTWTSPMSPSPGSKSSTAAATAG